MEWAQILVIILSLFLALFLLLAIVLVVMLIRVTRQIKTVTNTALRTVEKMESAASGMSRMTSPLVIVGIIKKLFKKKR